MNQLLAPSAKLQAPHGLGSQPAWWAAGEGVAPQGGARKPGLGFLQWLHCHSCKLPPENVDNSFCPFHRGRENWVWVKRWERRYAMVDKMWWLGNNHEQTVSLFVTWTDPASFLRFWWGLEDIMLRLSVTALAWHSMIREHSINGNQEEKGVLSFWTVSLSFWE